LYRSFPMKDAVFLDVLLPSSGKQPISSPF
jgi:hypothetical protein